MLGWRFNGFGSLISVVIGSLNKGVHENPSWLYIIPNYIYKPRPFVLKLGSLNLKIKSGSKMCR